MRLLKPKEVAKLLNVSERLLSYWRQNDDGPEFIQYGPRTVRYKPRSVEAWLNEHS
ncbi:helix-turn-helix domain-containing protein [Bifidobacterium sp. ESL0769]|uniref:helix-turn-helix transcriptional regulator n=1 Tax=Bifidobacterium sp. ESL0769 TaxID=2983229 RepID=UPI0023F640DE|nr:helix-turn-helix domain-containing protein [Bifidobacterium sp. ESL0769]WEV67961.1 helix-turn-helix domain-containing protein [Bifidobacterium sp. ESL0769]